ncbi:MAG: IPTL-CTERM sorting domain-containing protein [Acidobacteria bacterium]|nr:IPTL-CTERM sorting domain-containing protein [Acidobacteriota bacterium]
MRRLTRTPRGAAALLIALLPCTLVSAGIIELGRKGQLAAGSSFTVLVAGTPFSDPNHVAGEDASVILGRIRAQIAASGYNAVTVTSPTDPNLNAIGITNAMGMEPASLQVNVSDANIGGAVVDFGALGGATATVAGANAVTGNVGGTFEIDITLTTGALFTQIVTTPSKSATTVNSDMVAALTANGFTVAGPTNGPWTISRVGANLARVQMKRTDTGISVSNVTLVSAPAPSAPVIVATIGTPIPTLSEWGLVFLAALVALAGILRLRS